MVAEIQPSAVRLHDPPREVQADAEALVGAAARPLHLREQLEDPVALVRRDPGTVVGDLELDLPVGAHGAHLNGSVIAEIQRVLRHEHEGARREFLVRPHLRDEELVRDLGVDRSLIGRGELPERVVEDRPERDRLRRERRFALEGDHRTDVRDEPSEPPGRSLDADGEGAHVLAAQPALRHRQRGRGPLDRGDRCEQLMREDLHELGLHPVQLDQLRAQLLRSGERPPELLHDLPGHLGRQVALTTHASVDGGDDLTGCRSLDQIADRARAHHVDDRTAIELRRQRDDLGIG